MTLLLYKNHAHPWEPTGDAPPYAVAYCGDPDSHAIRFADAPPQQPLPLDAADEFPHTPERFWRLHDEAERYERQVERERLGW